MSGSEAQRALERTQALLAAGRPAEAEHFARQALQREPESEHAHGYLADALLRQERNVDALAVVEDGLTFHPSSDWLHRIRGIVLLGAAQPKAALEAIETALELGPACADAHHVHSLALGALGRVKEARRAAEEAVALEPDQHRFHARLGDTWLDECPAVAEQHYRAALALDPEQPATLNNLGCSLIDQDRHEEAAEVFRSALRFDPANADLKRGLLHATIPKRQIARVAILLLVAVLTFPILQAWGNRTPAMAPWTWAMQLAGLAAAFLYLWWAGRGDARREQETNPNLIVLRSRLLADQRSGHLPLRPAARRIGLGLAILGGLLLGIGGTFGVGAWHRYAIEPTEPRRSQLEEAKPDEWIALADGTLRCDTRRELGIGTFFVGRTASGRDFVASFKGRPNCEAASARLRGTVKPMNVHLAATLDKAGFQRPPGEPLWLTPWGGPAHHRVNALRLTFLSILGAVMLYFGLGWWRLPTKVAGSASD